jgi:acyl-CoA synthetase (AMP-forming)/AMP-acid ligase II
MKTVLMDRWEGDRGLDLMAGEQITFMIGPPSLFSALIEMPSFDPGKVASIRVVSTGMMGVSPAFIEGAREAMGAIVKRAYGSTEAPSVSTCTNEDTPERCRDTDGRSVGEAEIVAFDPATSRRRRPGKVGEIWIRGPELFAGYADPEDTAAALHRGWYRTGDMGLVEEGGWLRITGRLRELIIRGGENISATEVEHALERHPEVVQAVVVGMPDERLGERVAAFVVSRSALDVEEVRRWFGEIGIARFKTPEVVVRLDELPLLAAGKPDRAKLRARALEMAGA